MFLYVDISFYIYITNKTLTNNEFNMNSLDLSNDYKVETLQNKIVMQHNAITSGRYDFSACQLDILFSILAILKENELTYQLHIKDIEILTGRRWDYSQFRESTEDMLTRMFEITTENEYTQFVLFQSFTYKNGQGIIEVTLSQKSLPYFFELKNTFTTLQLKSVLGCSSKYAKRIYGLACQWRTLGVKEYEIIELKKILGLVDEKGKEQFVEITDFKLKVLEIAKKQINKNTDIEFDYEVFKKYRSRSFNYVKFFINANKFRQQLEIDFKKPIADQKFIRALEKWGFHNNQAEIIATKMKQSEMQLIIDECQDRIKRNKLTIDNSIAYMTKILKNKGILPK